MKRSDLYKGSFSWMARNPVAANLLMVMLLVGGVLMSQRINKEVFPKIEMDQVSISIAYPGSSPEEIERGLLLSVEEAVRPLDGVKKVYSVASEGSGSITVELEEGTNRNKALNDVQSAVDRISSFPDGIENPIVSMREMTAEAISLVVYGDVDEQTLHAYGERIREGLLGLSEVSRVEIKGVRSEEIGIELTQDAIRKYNVTLDGIARQIKNTAIETPGGGVKSSAGDILLRVQERRDYGYEFANIPIIFGNDGAQVSLGDIATINDDFEESDIAGFFNGKRALVLDVSSVGEQSPTQVAEAVKGYAETLRQKLPDKIKVTTWNDRAKMFEERLDLLLRNAAIGLALVLLILGLFLEPRLAFWVSLGIPVSFLGSFLFLPALGVSLNMISMFAFLVTLGMVVDDAIVVGENVFHKRNEGHPPIEAAILGVREMAMPVFFSIGTTVAAFFPLLMVPGTFGKIVFAVPVIVIFVLIISLIESFFILPAHLAHVKKNGRSQNLFGAVLRFQKAFSDAMTRLIETRFRPIVTATVRNRWITLAASLSLLIVVAGIIAGGRIKYIDFPKDDTDRVQVSATLPFGVSSTETERVMRRLVESGKRAIAAFGGDKITLGIFARLGQGASRGPRGSDGASSSNLTSVEIMLVSPDERTFSSAQFARTWREEFGPTDMLDTIVFSATMHGTRKAIDFELSHPDNEILQLCAQKVGEQLESFSGVHDIDNGIELGKTQWSFRLTPEGVNAGLTAAELARQVRARFYGSEALRQQRGRNEVKVMVRLTREERENLQSVENLMIRTPSGGEMPLQDVAEVDFGRAYTSIRRTDAKRTLQIQAAVDENQANANEIVGELFSSYLPSLEAQYPGLKWQFRGRQEDMQDFAEYMKLGFALALLAIFALIAIPLKSYLQPLFVVMSAIPFGMVGSVLGHVLLGMDLSMFSIMGMLALAGVVVNDSIVYVDTANNLRNEGLEPERAAIDAACRRFRPIFLTTATTFFGLMPMIFETDFSARMIVPMAVSLGFGIVVATTFVLLLTPALFVMTEHLRAFFKSGDEAEPQPAKEATEVAG